MPYLVNGVAAVGALAETFYNLGTGDIETARDSAIALGINTMLPVLSYGFKKSENIKEGEDNKFSAVFNSFFGILSNVVLELEKNNYHSRSISARLFPTVAITSVGLNVLEYEEKKEKPRKPPMFGSDGPPR